MGRRWQSIKNRGLLLLFIAFVTVIGIVFFAILRTDPNLATATVAFGTLLLAIVTAISIDNSRAIARRRREEELQKEKRDKQEQLLNEIIKWAIDVHNCSFGVTVTIDPQLEAKKQSKLRVGNRVLRYQALSARAEYIEAIAKVFEQKLPNAISLVTSHLETVRETLMERLENFEDTDIKKTLEDNEQLLRKSDLKLIKLTGNIKAGYLQTENEG